MIWQAVPRLLKQTVRSWTAHNAPQMGAAIAYYTVFSLAPLLILAIGLAGSVFGEKAARGEIGELLQSSVGREVADAIQALLDSAHNSSHGVVAAVLSIATMLFGASATFTQLQAALNAIWEVDAQRSGGWIGMIRERAFSFLTVLGTGILLLASLLLSTSLSAMNQWLGLAGVSSILWLWQLLYNCFSFAVVSVFFAMLYKLLPDVRILWREVWLGAAVTALLFTIGKYLLGLYLAHGGIASAFGAGGSIVLILLWVYYSAQIFLLGAEFTHAFAMHFPKTEAQQNVSSTEPAGLSG
jgi:membrane protein